MIYKGLHWIDTEADPQLGNYQQEQRDYLISLAGDGCVIDGGANIGIWTRDFLRHFDEVHAFEPIREVFECLELNAPEAKLYNKALGDFNGRIKLEFDNTRTFHTHISDNGVKVDVITIDSLELDPAIIKLDVEGMEHQAVIGASDTIARCHPVICVEQKHAYKGGRLDAVKHLESIGYKVKKIFGYDYILEWANGVR